MRISPVVFLLGAAALFACCASQAHADILPPTVVGSGVPSTFDLGGSPVVVDSGITVTSEDIFITGATEQITNFRSGDELNFLNQNGIFGFYNSAVGELTLDGTASPAEYQLALQSITFSALGGPGVRDISVIADDSSATPTTSNTVIESVNVVGAPEPASVVMMFLGAVGLLGLRRLRVRRAA